MGLSDSCDFSLVGNRYGCDNDDYDVRYDENGEHYLLLRSEIAMMMSLETMIGKMCIRPKAPV